MVWLTESAAVGWSLSGHLGGWCERGESNPYGCPLDPKSSASASSATLACLGNRTGETKKGLRKSIIPLLVGWCRRLESNQHVQIGHKILNLARLPIPPLRHRVLLIITTLRQRQEIFQITAKSHHHINCLMSIYPGETRNTYLPEYKNTCTPDHLVLQTLSS